MVNPFFIYPTLQFYPVIIIFCTSQSALQATTGWVAILRNADFEAKALCVAPILIW